MKTPGARPGVFTSWADPANRRGPKMSSNYFEAASEAAAAFFEAFFSAFIFLAIGAEAGAEAASAAKAPTAKVETIRAARSLVI